MEVQYVRGLGDQRAALGIVSQYLAGNYMFKVNNRNTRIRSEICSKLAIKDIRTTPISSFWCLNCHQLGTYFAPDCSVSVVNFQQVNACRDFASNIKRI